LTVPVAEEMHDVLGPGQQGLISLDDRAVETVICKTRKRSKSFVKVSIGRLLRCLAGYQNHLSWRLVESTVYSVRFPTLSPSVFKGAALGYGLGGPYRTLSVGVHR
jgi:hypothetical protein